MKITYLVFFLICYWTIVNGSSIMWACNLDNETLLQEPCHGLFSADLNTGKISIVANLSMEDDLYLSVAFDSNSSTIYLLMENGSLAIFQVGKEYNPIFNTSQLSSNTVDIIFSHKTGMMYSIQQEYSNIPSLNNLVFSKVNPTNGNETLLSSLQTKLNILISSSLDDLDRYWAVLADAYGNWALICFDPSGDVQTFPLNYRLNAISPSSSGVVGLVPVMNSDPPSSALVQFDPSSGNITFFNSIINGTYCGLPLVHSPTGGGSLWVLCCSDYQCLNGTQIIAINTKNGALIDSIPIFPSSKPTSSLFYLS